MDNCRIQLAIFISRLNTCRGSPIFPRLILQGYSLIEHVQTTILAAVRGGVDPNIQTIKDCEIDMERVRTIIAEELALDDEARENVDTMRACFAALCHGEISTLVQRYRNADPVREAIMLCLVPPTAVRAQAVRRVEIANQDLVDHAFLVPTGAAM